MALLTTKQVQDVFQVDRSTIYRMAEDGRLPAVKVGRQWRFPADQVERLLGTAANNIATNNTATNNTAGAPVPTEPPIDAIVSPGVAQAFADLVGELFGVMAVVTDMAGRPLTSVANPCGFFEALVATIDSDEAAERCSQGWRRLGEEVDLEPRFVRSHLGFLCARSFIRSGPSLVGMVIVGGLAPAEWPPSPEELAAISAETSADPTVVAAHVTEVIHMETAEQRRLLRHLAGISDLVSRVADDRQRLTERLDAIAALAGTAGSRPTSP